MTGARFRLGVDEVALAIAQAGFSETAREMVMWRANELVSSEVVGARLLAAGHSLLARGLVEVGPRGELVVSPPLATVARALARSDFSVRASLTGPEGERIETYHFNEGRIFRHVVVTDVVHDIETLSSVAEVEARVLEFVGGPTSASHSDPEATMPAEFERVARTGNLSSQDSMLGHEPSPATCSKVIEDLRDATSRGSVIRVDYESDGRPTSERGALLLRSGHRLWLMPVEPSADGVRVRALPASADAFKTVISSLTAPEPQ